MKISVIGTGYVGLITGVCLSDLGFHVTCVDNNEETIQKLENLEIPIYEPGLEDLTKKNHSLNKLHFTTNIQEAIENTETIFISVGTPGLKDGSVDLGQVYAVADDLANYMNRYKLIVIKSTVPVGTCQRIKKHIEDICKSKNKSVEFDIVSNPEFLREGSAIRDFNFPDRIVIGTASEKAAMLMKKIYDVPLFQNTPFVFTTIETSEMIKYATNAFLAAKISYINEIANICELCGADVRVVAKAMGLDKRIGEKFLNPGPGFGGSCFPKDTKALIKIAEDLGYKPEIVSSVMKSNALQRSRSVQKIIRAVGEPENKTFTLLGLSFKPETADIRESFSSYIMEELLHSGAQIRAYDPKAMENMRQLHSEPAVRYCDDALTACEGSDCIIIATEWDQFRNMDFKRIKEIVKNPLVIDLRNMFEPSQIRDQGFIYIGIGRQ